MARSNKQFTKRAGGTGGSAAKVWRFGKRLANAANSNTGGNVRSKVAAVLNEVLDPAETKKKSGTQWSGRANMRSKHTIYKLTNNKDGSVYIGRTNDLTARMVEHEVNAAKGAKGKLYDAIRKDGWKNFSKEAVETNLNSSEADKAERQHISKARSAGKCYNVQSGGKQGYAEWVSEKRAAPYKRGSGYGGPWRGKKRPQGGGRS